MSMTISGRSNIFTERVTVEVMIDAASEGWLSSSEVIQSYRVILAVLPAIDDHTHIRGRWVSTST